MQQYCFSPLWLAFAILIGGLLLDILISITLGVSALPVNIIIGMFLSFDTERYFWFLVEIFMVSETLKNRSYCGAWTWNCVSTCLGVLSGVEFSKRITKGGIKCHYWVLSSYIVFECLLIKEEKGNVI